MPVRNVWNRGQNIIGKFPSHKIHRMVQFESLIERDVIYLLEYDQNVLNYEEQPVEIQYQDGPVTRRYIPDFLVTFANEKKCLVECKPKKFVNHPKNLTKYIAAEEWCKSHGMQFFLAIDDYIRQGHVLKNIQFLAQYASTVTNAGVEEHIIAQMKTSTTARSIESIAFDVYPNNPNQVYATIFHLLYWQKLHIDLSTLISIDSSISLEKEFNNGIQQIFPWYSIHMDESDL